MAKKTWCIPKLTEEFRERMEDVLDQYEKPHDSTEPVICLDEQPYQLLDAVRPFEPAAPGKAAKEDYEYRRCGTCSVFVAVEPKGGKRFVQARRHRTRADFARFVRGWGRGFASPQNSQSLGAHFVRPHTHQVKRSGFMLVLTK